MGSLNQGVKHPEECELSSDDLGQLLILKLVNSVLHVHVLGDDVKASGCVSRHLLVMVLEDLESLGFADQTRAHIKIFKYLKEGFLTLFQCLLWIS